MFDQRHYVAILRWKQAERLALRELQVEDRKRITPLIELTPTILTPLRNDTTEFRVSDPAQILEREAKRLATLTPGIELPIRYWTGFSFSLLLGYFMMSRRNE